MGLPMGQKLVKSGSTWARLCGTHISETTGWIYPILSSMELSRPVVVQRHGHLTLTLEFQGQILKIEYLMNGRADWHGSKGMWIDRMLHPLCDFQHSRHPWPWPWIFKVKFWKSHISGMGWPIDMEFKRCESIEYWTHVVTFNLPLDHDLDLGFSRSNLKMLYLRNGRADWHGTKGMWVDRKLHPLCDFELSPQPWHWPWIFKVKFWKCCISGMGGPIDMERKRCESIGCYTHFVFLNFHLNHDLDLGFSRSNF